MVRNTAREIAIHLSYEMNFTTRPVKEVLDQRLTPEAFAALAEEESLYAESPDAKQSEYIRRLVAGVAEHGAELDGYISKYAVGWNFARIPLVAAAIMVNPTLFSWRPVLVRRRTPLWYFRPAYETD